MNESSISFPLKEDSERFNDQVLIAEKGKESFKRKKVLQKTNLKWKYKIMRCMARIHNQYNILGGYIHVLHTRKLILHW